MTRTTATLHEALGLRPSHHRRLYRAAAPGGAGDSHPAETGDTHSGLAAWGSQTHRHASSQPHRECSQGSRQEAPEAEM